MNPLVSIITPTYNSQDFIQQTIDSVVNQTYNNWELILIDDASTDKTVDIANKNIKDNPKIILIKNSINQGAGITRNIGIERAKGEFIAFLDADDLWKPEKLKSQIDFMIKNNVDVCFSSYDLINEKGSKLFKRVVALKELTYNKLLRSNYIGNLTGIYNCRTLGKIKSNKLRKRQDWILWLEAIKKSNKPAVGIQESLAYYRVRENSISSNKFNLLKYNFKVYKIGLGFSTMKSLKHFMAFLLEHFFVKTKQIKSIQKT